MRRPTLTERKPSPIGVVIGPLSATPFRRIDVERLLGQRVAAVRVHDVGAGRLDVPLEVDAGRLEHATRRLGELRAGSVAGDEGDTVGDRRRTISTTVVSDRLSVRV